MRSRNLLIVLLLLAALALAACGSGAAAEPAEEEPAVEEPVEATSAEEPTEEMTEEPAADMAEQPEGCLGTAEDALVDLECREVTIALENAYLPFNYIDLETGEPGGWDYDFLDEMCTRLHCTPVYQEAAWEGMIQAVADGQYDMAADGITITADRAEIVDFSDGYINIDQRLLVRKGEDRFANIEDFAADDSLVLGTQTGTTNYETATEYLPEGRIQAFEQFPFAVQALVTGDIDAVIIDETAGQGYLGENADELDLIGPPIVSQQLGFIFPLGSDLVDPVNQVISEMKADGSLEELSTEYFGPSFSITYDDIGPGAYDEEETDS
jgi:polar amino acid transport system substrate-binding protein